MSSLCVASGFRRVVCNMYTLLGFYAAQNGNWLPTFRDNLSGPILDCLSLEKIGNTDCPETFVKNYQSALCRIQEDRRHQLLCQTVSRNRSKKKFIRSEVTTTRIAHFTGAIRASCLQEMMPEIPHKEQFTSAFSGLHRKQYLVVSPTESAVFVLSGREQCCYRTFDLRYKDMPLA